MKLLVSDFDGTFSTSISDIKFNCIEIAKFIRNGNIFVLSSGRSYQSLLSVVKKYGIPHNHLTCFNGICTYDSNAKLLYKYEMDNKILNELYNLKSLNIHEKMYYVYADDYVEKKLDLPISEISIQVSSDNITREFTNEFNRLKNKYEFYDFIIEKYFNDVYFVIKPKGVNKSVAVNNLREMLNINYSDVYTVGNDLNDLEMIRDFNGYAVGDLKEVNEVSIDKYKNVHTLVKDINNGSVKRRF